MTGQNDNKMFVSDKTYKQFSDSICKLLEEARRHTVRSVNAILAATYWEIGRRVVEFEQEGKERAEYGSALLQRLSKDLTKRFGRGFGVDNLQRMRAFYLEYKPETIYATLSRKSKEENVSSEKYAALSHISVEQIHQIKSKTASRIFTLKELASVFPLPWSAYVRLLQA